MSDTEQLYLPLLEAPSKKKLSQTTEKLRRLDVGERRKDIVKYCRLDYGDVWEDPIKGHRVGVLDATKDNDVQKLLRSEKANLVINDPPYNVKVGNANTRNLSKISIIDYITFSKQWIINTLNGMQEHSHLYIWIGADYKDNFQPLPDFMIMMRDFSELQPRNFITMRNQRGFGTQQNWMWVRQELLHYTRGKPGFQVTYTDIPKILRGYYKVVNGKMTENLERGKSDTIRPGNVWVDIQQVFYRMEENVPGCYAQKPLNAIERIVLTSSNKEDLIVDLFAHSGTTLIAGERTNRKVYTMDNDPVFAELTIRRLENYRDTGRTGWQWQNPFYELEIRQT
jgi:site-specific DNA-methyltransferase (adenine-specific)